MTATYHGPEQPATILKHRVRGGHREERPPREQKRSRIGTGQHRKHRNRDARRSRMNRPWRGNIVTNAFPTQSIDRSEQPSSQKRHANESFRDARHQPKPRTPTERRSSTTQLSAHQSEQPKSNVRAPDRARQSQRPRTVSMVSLESSRERLR